MIDLKREEQVFVLTMDNDENRFNATSIAALHQALDEVDAEPGPKALVTVGQTKFYCNGLDLDWLMNKPADESPEFMDEVFRLFGRILFNPAPTAAAINGHAFAGGAMLACAHDYRVMRSDRGYFCVPEVDLGMPLATPMTATLQARLPAHALHQAVVTGKRWGAEELVANNMMEAAAPEADVLPTALAWAAGQAHHAGETLATMKRDLYPHALALLLP